MPPPDVWSLLLLLLLPPPRTSSLLEEIRKSTCETVPTTVHVTKEEYNDIGILQRSCEADVAVNKCEGSCSSQIQPSVNAASGFSKECSCCRETGLRKRVLLLTRCYDPDGIQLQGHLSIMKVAIKEPADCLCLSCQEKNE